MDGSVVISLACFTRELVDKSNVKLLYSKCLYLPALIELQTDPDIAFEDPYFGGQEWLKLIADECMPHVPYMFYSQYFDLFMTYGTAAIQKVATGELTPEEALREAARLINVDIPYGR